MQKYHVYVSQPERHAFHQLRAAGRGESRQLVHARILLKADLGAEGPAWSDEPISQAMEVSISPIRRIRHRFITHGLADALNRRPQPERPEKRIFAGEKEAHLITLTCGEKPEGEGRWSLRLLSERLVKLGQVEQVSHETVRQALKKPSGQN
jgi:Homeodomain-like domain